MVKTVHLRGNSLKNSSLKHLTRTATRTSRRRTLWWRKLKMTAWAKNQFRVLKNLKLQVENLKFYTF